MPPSHNRKKTSVRIAFGKAVRARREELELTQEELAEKSSLHPTYIGSVERGERNISLENIVALAKALNYPAGKLIPE